MTHAADLRRVAARLRLEAEDLERVAETLEKETERSESGPEPLLDTEGVCRLIGASEPKVKAFVAAGMPAIPSGGQKRFERVAVLDWLRAGHGKGVVTVGEKRSSNEMEPC